MDPYEVLGVSRDCSWEQAEAAWKRRRAEARTRAREADIPVERTEALDSVKRIDEALARVEPQVRDGVPQSEPLPGRSPSAQAATRQSMTPKPTERNQERTQQGRYRSLPDTDLCFCERRPTANCSNCGAHLCGPEKLFGSGCAYEAKGFILCAYCFYDYLVDAEAWSRIVWPLFRPRDVYEFRDRFRKVKLLFDSRFERGSTLPKKEVRSGFLWRDRTRVYDSPRVVEGWEVTVTEHGSKGGWDVPETPCSALVMDEDGTGYRASGQAREITVGAKRYWTASPDVEYAKWHPGWLVVSSSPYWKKGDQKFRQGATDVFDALPADAKNELATTQEVRFSRERWVKSQHPKR